MKYTAENSMNITKNPSSVQYHDGSYVYFGYYSYMMRKWLIYGSHLVLSGQYYPRCPNVLEVLYVETFCGTVSGRRPLKNGCNGSSKIFLTKTFMRMGGGLI
jgi:hypothetical protein